MRPPPALGPRSLAAIGAVLCFLIASFFSGCIFDEAFVQKALNPGPCIYYPAGHAGTYTIIYHRAKDPPNTFLHTEVLWLSSSDDEVIDLNSLQPSSDPGGQCDQILSVNRTG